MSIEFKTDSQTFGIAPIESLQEFISCLQATANNLPKAFDLAYVNSDEKEVIVKNQQEYDVAFALSKTQEVVFYSIAKKPCLSESSLLNIRKEEAETQLRFSIEDDSMSISGNEFDSLESMEESPDNATVSKSSTTVECIKCHGNGFGKNKKGCKGCLGTGSINKYMFKYFKRQLKKASKTTEQILNSLKTSIYEKSNPTCSKCEKHIKEGKLVFVCRMCDDLIFCESCEDKVSHEHLMPKLWVEGEKQIYKVNVLIANTEENLVEKGETFVKLLTVKNIGKRDFPIDTMLMPVAHKKRLKTVEIGKLPVGQHFDVCLKINASNKPGDYLYIYRLKINDQFVGEDIKISFKVKEVNSNELSEEKCKDLFDLLKKCSKSKHVALTE